MEQAFWTVVALVCVSILSGPFYVAVKNPARFRDAFWLYTYCVVALQILGMTWTTGYRQGAFRQQIIAGTILRDKDVIAFVPDARIPFISDYGFYLYIFGFLYIFAIYVFGQLIIPAGPRKDS
jgi:hypothetical protein